MTKEIVNKDYEMKKEWKLDAFICITALNNPKIHFNLHNLYMYMQRNGTMTEEEIITFDKLLSKIRSDEHQLQQELFEDDPFFKQRGEK